MVAMHWCGMQRVGGWFGACPHDPALQMQCAWTESGGSARNWLELSLDNLDRMHSWGCHWSYLQRRQLCSWRKVIVCCVTSHTTCNVMACWQSVSRTEYFNHDTQYHNIDYLKQQHPFSFKLWPFTSLSVGVLELLEYSPHASTQQEVAAFNAAREQDFQTQVWDTA